MSSPASLGIGAIDQIAFVVRDLESAVAEYAATGLGPWDIYTYGPHRCSTMTYNGETRPYIMKLALCTRGSIMYELIETVEGPNCYQDHLDRFGEGFHHFGYGVPDIDAEIARMESLGFALLQSGRGFGVDGDGAYAYFDTASATGCILEAITFPREMPEPEQILGQPQ